MCSFARSLEHGNRGVATRFCVAAPHRQAAGQEKQRRAWQVYVGAEAPYRASMDNIGQFYVRNVRGQMVPLSALTRYESRFGPEFKMRFNEYSAAQIIGNAAPGYSSDQATAALEEVFHQTMPPEMGFDYMGMSRQEQKAREGLPSWVIFSISLVFVFLILAAVCDRRA